MLAKVHSATLLGVDGHRVTVEVHVGKGLPSFTVVGLPDTSCRESRDRIRAALQSSGLKWSDLKVTVNLAPTHVRKVGSGLDLAIAVALLAASDQLPVESTNGMAFLGELGLDGAVRPVLGALPLVDAAGSQRPIVPVANLAEARLVHQEARAVRSIGELVVALRGESPWPDVPDPVMPPSSEPDYPDLADVEGQAIARRALEVAAAGGHHLLMVGPPGAGKTMLAERLPSILPDLDDERAMEASRVHSVAGSFKVVGGLLRRPPFRSPHHTASLVAMIGGGTATLRPGEVSLASGGVLFLDELGEFPASHLDALRQPLESGEIHVARAVNSAILPARFLLVAATNPCPCGLGEWGDCRCSAAQIARYRRRMSTPFLDRFDIRLAVDPPDPSKVFVGGHGGETSADVRQRVAAARSIAADRGIRCNRELKNKSLDRYAPLASDASQLLRGQLERGKVSMRGAQRLRSLALTIKDLAGESGPLTSDDLSEALVLRGDLAELAS